MDGSNMYPIEITKHEERLGFIRAYVTNPRSEFAYQPRFVPAVIYRIAPGNRITKLRNPDGGIEYSHQVFGAYGNSERFDWMPVLVPFPTAELAIKAMSDGFYQTDSMAQSVRIAVDKIAMPLCCPACAEEFSVADDHLQIGSSHRCPACGKENQVEAFNSLTE